jgi:hypothetical protein
MAKADPAHVGHAERSHKATQTIPPAVRAVGAAPGPTPLSGTGLSARDGHRPRFGFATPTERTTAVAERSGRAGPSFPGPADARFRRARSAPRAPSKRDPRGRKRRARATATTRHRAAHGSRVGQGLLSRYQPRAWIRPRDPSRRTLAHLRPCAGRAQFPRIARRDVWNPKQPNGATATMSVAVHVEALAWQALRKRFDGERVGVPEMQTAF